jgi:hypothetical protein
MVSFDRRQWKQAFLSSTRPGNDKGKRQKAKGKRQKAKGKRQKAKGKGKAKTKGE